MGAHFTDTTSLVQPGSIVGTVFGPGDEIPDWADALVGDHLRDEPRKGVRASAPSTDAEVSPLEVITELGAIFEQLPARLAEEVLDAVNPRLEVIEGHLVDLLAKVDEASSAPGDEGDGGSEVGDGPPPRTGAGSGRDAWAEFAATHKVAVADDAKREDIISALEAAGVIQPEA